MNTFSKTPLNPVSLVIVLLAAKISAQVPSAIVVPDGTVVATFHAEGAQIYECKLDSDNKSTSQVRAPTWQFCEPIAAFLVEGQSIGGHYTGPSWDHIDGSGVRGKVAASAPGATLNDIPWLKIDVSDHRGDGMMSNVTTVQRINTKSGVVQRPCESVGNYRSVPYSADYVFLRQATDAGPCLWPSGAELRGGTGYTMGTNVASTLLGGASQVILHSFE